MRTNELLKGRTRDLKPHDVFFYQYAIARLMRAGMWFSDAIQVIQLIMPNACHSLPDDWEHTYYDITRDALGDEHLPMPTYKTIW